MTREFSKTKTATLLLLLHFVYIAFFAFFLTMANALELPCNRDGLYTAVAFIAIFLLCLYPIVATAINAFSIFFRIAALRSREWKLTNVLLMAVTVLYELAVIVAFAWFGQRAMGV